MKIPWGSVMKAVGTLMGVDTRGGWWAYTKESFSGAWQRNITISHDSVMSFTAVFSCITLIAGDIAKMPFKYVKLSNDGIWVESTSSSFSPVLRKPNRFQNHIQFKEYWIISKLSRGNTYVLKQRDARGVVVALYVLDPCRTKPLVADDGSVFYELTVDNLSGLKEGVVVPASEIIHDRFNCLFHPLVGLSPIFACGLSATQGLSIQNNATRFFQNGSRPGGVLSAPGSIGPDTAARIKQHWDENFTGENAGKVAVLGDDLTYTPLAMTAQDSQMIELLKYTEDNVCSTFHMPKYKVTSEAPPSTTNVEALAQDYYSSCLQRHIEDMELCLDEGLGLGLTAGAELDTDVLLRMDSATLYNTLAIGTSKSMLKLNEARKRLNLPPVNGGDTIYMQQQNYSLDALAKRDASDDPFGGKNAAPALPDPSNQDNQDAAANGNQDPTKSWLKSVYESYTLEMAA